MTIKKAQRVQFQKFLEEQLENSGIELLQSSTEIMKIRSNNTISELLLLNGTQKVTDVRNHLQNLYSSGIPHSFIFYKDGETFHKRLAQSAQYRGDKSLKKYSHEELNAMLHLRDLERNALRADSDTTPSTLTYYQGETSNVQEQFRIYEMLPVLLDYSHIRPEDRKFNFVINKYSNRYRIAQEISRGNSLQLQTSRNNSLEKRIFPQ